MSVWIANAAISIAAVSYLSLFAPGIASVPALPALLAVALVWGVTLVNLFGARSAGGFQLVTMVLKLLPLIAVIVIVMLLAGGVGDADVTPFRPGDVSRSEEHTSELQSLMRISYAVFCLKKQKNTNIH